MATRALARALDSRARRYDPAETRSRVVEAAMRLFGEKGYVATGTADIARAAEVSEGSIFYHFGSKRGLLAEIGRLMGEAMVAAMRAGDDPADITPAISIERCFAYCAQDDLWMRITGKGRCDGKGLMDGTHHINPEAEPFFQAARDVIVEWVEHQLAAAYARHGYGRGVNIRYAAALLHAAVGEAMEMASSPELDDAGRAQLVAETKRFCCAACGFPVPEPA